MGALQGGPGGQIWPTQNFGWVGHNAFAPPHQYRPNWPICIHRGQLILRKISQIIGTTRCVGVRFYGQNAQNSFSLELRPRPAGGACSAAPYP